MSWCAHREGSQSYRRKLRLPGDECSEASPQESIPRETPELEALTKKAQIEAYQDPEKRFYIARAVVEAKLERTRDLVKWFGSRYEIDQKSVSRLGDEIRRFEGCRALKDLLFVEGRVAEVYWKIFLQIPPVPRAKTEPVGYKAKDGHITKSYGERFLDDWLHEHILYKHEYNCPVQRAKREVLCDWYIPKMDLHIEF